MYIECVCVFLIANVYVFRHICMHLQNICIDLTKLTIIIYFRYILILETVKLWALLYSQVQVKHDTPTDNR